MRHLELFHMWITTNWSYQIGNARASVTGLQLKTAGSPIRNFERKIVAGVLLPNEKTKLSIIEYWFIYFERMELHWTIFIQLFENQINILISNELI